MFLCKSILVVTHKSMGVPQRMQEDLELRFSLEATGYNFNWLVNRVAASLQIEPEKVLATSKYAPVVKARRLLCYRGVRELGMATVNLAKMLYLEQPTISQAVVRGQKIANELKLQLLE